MEKSLKRLLSFALAVLMVLSLVPFSTLEVYAAEDPIDAQARIGDTYYETLQAALDAAAAGTGEVTVEILQDVDLTDVDWTPVTVSAPGYPVVTVNGNGKTITGLSDMLFVGTWAGKSGLIINDLIIKDSAIANDVADSKGTVGVGAFIGYPQASATITLNNCHLVDSTVEGGHWTGGLIGMAGGYNGNDGPVFMNLTIKDCSVTGSEITGKGSVGGVIGHGSCAAWTNVVIENTEVSNNIITSTGSSTVKAGSVMGTIGAAGQPTTAAGETKTGGAFVSAVTSDNTVTSNGTVITTVYGRQGTNTGMLTVTGGTYEACPIEENVSYAAPAAGYVLVENGDGTYGVAADPAFGKVAKIGNTYYETLAEALTAAQSGDTVEILETGTYALSTSGKNITITGAVDGVVFENIGKKNLGGASITFNNVTFNYAENSTYMGLQHSGDLTYNNCTFNGQVFLYGTSETFNGCTFNTSDANNYNVWTYSAKTVAFNDCTFNCAGKSVLIYHEGASVFNTVSATDCTFKASSAVDGKAAIEMDSSLTAGISLTVTNSTATGFGTGNVSGNSLWNNKKGSSTDANNDITVVVNNETVLSPVAFIAYIGTTGYASIAAAIQAAKAGDTVKIMEGTYPVPAMKAGITIEGVGEVLLEGTLSGTLENLTLKNLHIKGANAQRWAYAKGDLLFENVTFEATSVYALHFDGITAGANLTYKDCTIIGWAALGGSPASCVFDGCTIKGNDSYGVIRTYFDTTIENCTFDVDNVNTTDIYQDGIHAVGGATVTVNDCTNANGDMKDLVNISSTSVVMLDGEKIQNVAKIGDTYYKTLQAAIDAAGEGDTVTVLTDVQLTEGITVAADKKLTLDLAGKTISQTKLQTAGYQMILNDGDLTIADSVGGGKISYTDSGNGGEYISDTIYNRGVLVINGGTIENLSSATVASNGYPHAVDNYSGIRDTSLTVNDGTIYCAEYSAIRMFCVSATNNADLVINGGTIQGAVDMQNGSKVAALGTLTVNGGTFETTKNANNIRFANWNGGATEYGITSSIKGGSFNGGITTKYVPVAANWNSKIISGGSFTQDLSAYCATGYVLVENGDGTYGVKVTLPEVAITDIKASLTNEDPDLTFALNFAIPNVEDLSEEYLTELFTAYGDHYVDYVLTINGLNGDSITFNANGNGDGYLAGQYDAYGEAWVAVPFSDVVVNDGESLYIMEYAAKLLGKQGLRFTLAEVAAIVQNFDCGVYFTPEFLAAHPDLVVSLQLKVFTEDAEGNKIENIDVATNEFENEYAAAISGDNKQTVYYTTFAEAYAAAQAGDTVELLADVELTGKLTIDKAITIDGNGCSIIADEDAIWYTTGSKPLYLPQYKTHLVGINSDNVTLKDVVLDCNDNATGINLYCVDGIVFDNVSVINASKGTNAAITVNGSTLTVGNKLVVETTKGAFDISNGSGVTGVPGVTVEDGTVFDLGNRAVTFGSNANNDMTGAVKADGTPYFAAMDNAYYYTQAQIDSRTTGYTNGLTLLTDVTLNQDTAISGTLNLNGCDLTIADGKSLNVESSLTITGEGNITGTIKLTVQAATLIAPAGMTNVVSGVEGYKVTYSSGMYMLVAENIVAWNMQTSTQYETVEEAVRKAKANETVQLLTDSDESGEAISIRTGRTLDLNGYTLTIDEVMTSANDARITDSTNGNGLIVIDRELLSLVENEQSLVWIEENGGYRFETVTYGTQVQNLGDGKGQFNFYLKDEEGIVFAELADGADDNDGLSIQIMMTYTNNQGTSSTLYFDFPMDLVKDYAAVSKTYLSMSIKGLDTVADVTFTAVLKCGNVLIESAATAY